MRDARMTAGKFAQAWARRDWRAAAALSQPTWKHERDDPEAALEELLGPVAIAGDPEVGKPQVISSAVSDLPVTVDVGSGAEAERRTLTFRLVRERGPYEPAPDGRWFVNPVSALRGLGSVTGGGN